MTKNEKEAAIVVPTPADARERLIAAGLVQPGPEPLLLSELKLETLAADASPAIEAILRGRGEK